jgi:hypothetical protein
MEKVFCDICGKEIKPNDSEFSVSLYKDRPNEDQLVGWDLCVDDKDAVFNALRVLKKQNEEGKHHKEVSANG